MLQGVYLYNNLNKGKTIKGTKTKVGLHMSHQALQIYYC